MPVLHINGRLVLFIHIPKTGGSSIEAALAEHGPLLAANGPKCRDLPCSPAHFHRPLLEAVLPVDRIDYSFMFVRHPLDRMLSEYRYTTRKPGRWQNMLGFRAWLRAATAMRRLDPYHRDNHLRPQWEFALADTEVLRFEDGLERGLQQVLARVGASTRSALLHLKGSGSPHAEVSRKDAEAVWKLYRADYERFGYNLWPATGPAADPERNRG